jgi:hypothetical protein
LFDAAFAIGTWYRLSLAVSNVEKRTDSGCGFAIVGLLSSTVRNNDAADAPATLNGMEQVKPINSDSRVLPARFTLAVMDIYGKQSNASKM